MEGGRPFESAVSSTGRRFTGRYSTTFVCRCHIQYSQTVTGRLGNGRFSCRGIVYKERIFSSSCENHYLLVVAEVWLSRD